MLRFLRRDSKVRWGNPGSWIHLETWKPSMLETTRIYLVTWKQFHHHFTSNYPSHIIADVIMNCLEKSGILYFLPYLIFVFYHLVTPPSIQRSCPVIYELASLARKTHPPRISSGSATLPFIISSFQLSRRCGNYQDQYLLIIHLIFSELTGAVISVLTYPGDIELTRIPYKHRQLKIPLSLLYDLKDSHISPTPPQ